jgi:D-serine deaminase-like pyridoxal phosphate-dependent protein
MVAERGDVRMSTSRPSPNAALVGQLGSRLLLDTPALVLDLDAFELNLRTVHGRAKERRIALRPHAKSHKSAAVGRAQLAAGAIGLCCAKLGEAEALAAAGLDGFLITAPVTSRPKVQRLMGLNARLADLAVVVDDVANVAELAAATAEAGRQLKLLIDVDVGTHRMGVTSPEAALALAKAIREADGLELVGVQGYAGQTQAIPSYAERRAASGKALAALADVRDALVEQGHPCPIVTGSGTGTHDFDHEFGLFTDLQVGSYVFSDVIYNSIEIGAGGDRPVLPALFVVSRVISRQHRDFATIDAGSKSFSMDGPMPVLWQGPTPGSTYGRFGDQFGRLDLTGADRPVELGELTTWMVPHCDPTMNLYDHYHCVRGDDLVDIWAIEARGRTD